MKKVIYDITPVTMLDYPDHLSAIIWFCGCSLRCAYCYNPDIVFAKEGTKTEEDVLVLLSQRTRFMDAVVLSGGECTDYFNIINFCQELKQMGYKIKIDTNGTNPTVLKKLITNNLIDYIALDYKAPEYKYTLICSRDMFELFSNSLNFLLNSNVEFEVRTTVGYSLLDVNDIQNIADDLVNRGYSNTYYLQKFINSNRIISEAECVPEPFDVALLKSPLDIQLRE